jgi:uncharacterized protein YdhG (YjbR/CyaY superfamily)
MPATRTVDDYIAGFPPDVADRLSRIRSIILEAVRRQTGAEPEEKMRYGIAAVMLGGRYALHYAGWKKHIGLYPVPVLPEPLESEIAPYRSEKDSVTFPHSREVPYALVEQIAREVADRRGGTDS